MKIKIIIEICICFLAQKSEITIMALSTKPLGNNGECSYVTKGNCPRTPTSGNNCLLVIFDKKSFVLGQVSYSCNIHTA